MKTEAKNGPFLAALRGERPQRRPIWIMRQAGRYLPEYQRLRSRHSFVEICKTPELACEATLQPIRRFGFDAAILFNDILVPLEPSGSSFVFTDEGPRLEKSLREESDISALKPFEPRESLPFVAEAIRLIKKELNGTPLIGFSGAPFTLAAYLIEGGGSKDYRNLKTILYNRPELMHDLLDKLCDQVLKYLQMQIDAGADAVQLFDSWSGILTPSDYKTFALPRIKRIFKGLAETGAPRILFLKGASAYLPHLADCCADAISLDWTVDLESALPLLNGMRIQGNLDPLALFAKRDEIQRRAKAVCRAGDSATGHVFNLGHGILPQTPVDSVETLVQAVHEYRPGD